MHTIKHACFISSFKQWANVHQAALVEFIKAFSEAP